MARFQFRLATLLRLREVARDERRAQLAEAFRMAETLEAQHAEIVENLRQVTQMRAATAGQVHVDRLLAASRYEAVLMLEQLNLQRRQAALREEIERRREALVAADRDVRTLEQLRETQQERHRDEREREQMKLLDEVALRGFGREEAEPWDER